MKPVKLSRQILSVGLLALAISLGYFAAQSPVDALPTPPDGGGGRPTNRGSSGSHVVLPPPPNQGAPGQRSSSTSRGDCLPQQLDLTALVPAIQTENEDGFWGTHVFGQTTAASPTLWFHISESVADATLEFVLQDDDDWNVYRTTVPLPDQAGLVSVFLPAEQVSLEAGERYHWFAKLKEYSN
jgi:hypothetical protein